MREPYLFVASFFSGTGISQPLSVLRVLSTVSVTNDTAVMASKSAEPISFVDSEVLSVAFLLDTEEQRSAVHQPERMYVSVCPIMERLVVVQKEEKSG